MIKTKNKGVLVIISGPSGVGKGTICGKLLKKNSNICESISMTSREPRNGEKNGREYYFVSKEEFELRIKKNEFLEYAIVHNGKYYGTPTANIAKILNDGKDVLLEIDIQGALSVQKKIKGALFIFIMPPSMDELKNRLIKRNTETKDKILERFKTAYNEINEYSKYNYVVVNDNINDAVDKVNSIIKAEKCRVDRIEEVFLNTTEEKIHEEIVDKNFDNNDQEI